MRCLATLILAVALSWSAMGPLWAQDLAKDFLGKPWGAPIADFPELAKVGSNGKIAYYIHPKQAYTLFGVQVSNLVYGFYENKFFAVFIRLGAIDTYSNIKSQIQQKFGIPKISMESRGKLTTYSWKTGEIRIKMKYYDATGVMKLGFYYMPISTQVNFELKQEMDAEPPEPLFPLSPTRQKEALKMLDVFNYTD